MLANWGRMARRWDEIRKANMKEFAIDETFTDCKVTDAALTLPATGLCSATFGIKGLGLTRGTDSGLAC